MEKKYKHLTETFEVAPVVIAYLDKNLVLTDMNQRAEKMFLDKDRSELIGKHILEVSPTTAERVEIYKEVIRSGKTAHIRSTMLALPGAMGRHVSIFAFMVDELLCLMSVDITDWILEKEKMITGLQEKNQELEQFAHVASHELQEPLRTISGFTQLIRDENRHEGDESIEQYLEFILHATDRLKTLTRSLLEYGRLGRNRDFEIVDCDRLMHEITLDLAGKIKESNAQISSDTLPSVWGNESELKILFQNLVSNAIKYSREDESPKISITVAPENAFSKFTISDNGIGFDEKYKFKVFMIFQRLHNPKDYSGSGVGLALCKKIVEIHGGKIWAESKPGKGSSFHFTLKTAD